MINKWKRILSLTEWTIIVKSIDPESVLYDDECPKEDRYYVGVQADYDNYIATIYHDRELTEEDIVHELLHVSHPKWTEDQVNQVTELLLKN